MKNFLKFFTEAKASVASERAKKMGLKGDGHGGWYNASGEFVAKTEGGELKFYNKGQKPGKDQPEDAEKKAQAATTPQKTAAPKAPAAGEDEKSQGNALTVVFGRFNPPTTGHKKLLDTAYGISSGSDFKVYPSRSQDAKKNPLNPDSKVQYMKKMFPKYEDNIVNDDNMKTIFNVLQGAYDDGYTEVTIVVGSDRLGEFKNLANKYNGELYDFENISVVSAGERDADAEGVEGMSASKMRKAATEDDFQTFRSGIPNALDDKDAKALFALIKKQMGTSEKKEVEELWQIAPKLDMRNLRENYVADRIYSIGDIVENLNTGLIGEVIRRGTNHLICLTQESLMFKSWIKDVTESAYTDQSGVPASEREVGTDSLRKYAMALTHTTSIHNFINKYKKKSK